MSTYIEIKSPPPGYDNYLENARANRVAKGGLTIVMPDGKWAHVPFELTTAALGAGGNYIEHFFMAAARNMTKLLASQSFQETQDG